MEEKKVEVSETPIQPTLVEAVEVPTEKPQVDVISLLKKIEKLEKSVNEQALILANQHPVTEVEKIPSTPDEVQLSRLFSDEATRDSARRIIGMVDEQMTTGQHYLSDNIDFTPEIKKIA